MTDRTLILVNSVYQLLTAVHLRRTLLRGVPADLILTDILPGRDRFAGRTEELGLFDRVLTAQTADFNREYAGKKGDALDPAFQEIPRRLGWMLSGELDGYTAVYFSNFDPFTRLLACFFYALPCRFFCYEDGFSSYVIDYLRGSRAPINRHAQGRLIADKVQGVLLYEPRLALREDSLPNLSLPKIDPADHEFRALLNRLFDYHRPQIPADFLFLEQSFRAEGIRTNDLELMRLCQEAVGAGRFAVKPHPRNPVNRPFQLGLTRKFPADVPWELFLLNEERPNDTVITVCSNAALTSRIVFGMDRNTVMLYHLFSGKVLWQEDALLRQYLRKFHRQFAGGNYYVPRTVYELKEILNYLGGPHEPTDSRIHHHPGLSGGKLPGTGRGLRH